MSALTSFAGGDPSPEGQPVYQNFRKLYICEPRTYLLPKKVAEVSTICLPFTSSGTALDKECFKQMTPACSRTLSCIFDLYANGLDYSMVDVGENQVISLADAASFAQALGPTTAGAVLSRITSHNMTGQQLTSYMKHQIAQLKKHVGAGRVGRWEPESLHTYLRCCSAVRRLSISAPEKPLKNKSSRDTCTPRR